VILALQIVLRMRVPETPSVALTRRAGFSFVLRLKGGSARHRGPRAGFSVSRSSGKNRLLRLVDQLQH
jgi:hypothetical protein